MRSTRRIQTLQEQIIMQEAKEARLAERAAIAFALVFGGVLLGGLIVWWLL